MTLDFSVNYQFNIQVVLYSEYHIVLAKTIRITRAYALHRSEAEIWSSDKIDYCSQFCLL